MILFDGEFVAEQNQAQNKSTPLNLNKMKPSKQTTKPVLIVIVATALLLFPGIRLPYFDKNTDAYFNSAITEAGEAYAVCRVVNASVSVVKESDLEIEPAGLGVSLALGQIVDPIYDLTERSSDVFITSIVSLGVQKIAYEISVQFAPPVIGILLISILILSYVKHRRAKILVNFTMRLMILVFLARFCLPASSLVNSFLQDKYFAPQVKEAKNAISINSPELEKLKVFTMPQADGVYGTLKNGFNIIESKSSELAGALAALVKNMNQIVNNLLRLTALYVTIFVVQVILLPISTYWCLAKITNALFGTKIPNLIRHSQWSSRLQTKKTEPPN